MGALSLNCWTNREPQTPGNISQIEASQRSSSQHQDPALSNCLQTRGLKVSGQTTSKRGIQHHPLGKKKILLQVKEQGKNLKDQINEDEIGNQPEKEFRVMIVKMIQNLINRMKKIQETVNKYLEEQRANSYD